MNRIWIHSLTISQLEYVVYYFKFQTPNNNNANLSMIEFNNQQVIEYQSYYEKRYSLQHTYTNDLVCSDCMSPLSLNATFSEICQKRYSVLETNISPQYFRCDKNKSFSLKVPMTVDTNPFFELALDDFQQDQYTCDFFSIKIKLR